MLWTAPSRTKNESGGRVEPSHRCSAYLCMERDGQVVGYPVGGRVPGGGCRVVGLVGRLACPPVPLAVPARPTAVHCRGGGGGCTARVWWWLSVSCAAELSCAGRSR